MHLVVQTIKTNIKKPIFIGPKDLFTSLSEDQSMLPNWTLYA